MQSTSEEERERILKCRVIALGMGWSLVQPARLYDDGTEHEGPYWWDENHHYVGGGTHNPVPKFFESVDACLKACKTISLNDWSRYLDLLSAIHKTDILRGDIRRYMEINAPSEVRAEALYQLFSQ